MDAETLRQQAKQHDRDAQESFERSDTDGFVSQWASDITARLKRLKADLLDKGGIHEFPALFDLTGKRMRAKLHHSKYGLCWMFFDANNKPTGKFISAFPKKEATMTRKGYREGTEMAPAKAEIVGGSGYGLSGVASCYPSIIRADNGYPPEE